MLGEKLTKSFYANPDVTDVAKKLLGKVLVSEYDGVVCSGLIVETEAYRTPDDLACHAVRFPHTKRGKDMVSEAGIAYVYYCRNHPLFNILTGEAHSGDAVLIRAIEPFLGVEVMRMRRHKISDFKQLTNGPGKLTRALGITVENTHLMDLCKPVSQVYVLNNVAVLTEIKNSRRIRVEGAGEEADSRMWRYYLADNKFVSEPQYKWRSYLKH